MKSYKAYNPNGENGCYVHAGSNSYIVKYESRYESPGPHFVLITDVADNYDAFWFLEFITNGYAEHLESYKPEEYDWLKENGLPIDFSGKLKYMKYLHTK